MNSQRSESETSTNENPHRYGYNRHGQRIANRRKDQRQNSGHKRIHLVESDIREEEFDAHDILLEYNSR